MSSFAIMAVDKEHDDAISLSLRVLGIFISGAPPRAIVVSGEAPTPEPHLMPPRGDIPGASLSPFVTTDHAVNRPLHIDAQIRRHLCAYFPVHGGFKEAQQLCPGVSDADRKAEGCCQILREEGHDTRS